MAYDPKVVKTLARIWRKRYAGGGIKPWERKLGKSSYATGIVESGLRNLGYGHADSEGWRQERRQFYDNPQNVVAATKRYFNEAEPFAKRGLSLGAIAQGAQQSAFPSRYAEQQGEAARLFRKHMRGGGSSNNLGARTSQDKEQFDMPRTAASGGKGDRLERLWETFGRLNEAANPQPEGESGDQDYLTRLQDDTAQMLEENRELIDKLRSMNDSRRPKDVDDETASKELPGDTPKKLQTMIERASKMDKMRKPYLWGGGHGPTPDMNGPWDCSGAVSAVLGVNPRVSGQFAAWGKPGRGKHVTIYANAEHVLMEIDGRFFGTSGSNPGGGAGWIPRTAVSKSYLSRFTARHPNGL